MILIAEIKGSTINESLCQQCGGQCCQNYAGSYTPMDFQQPLTPDFIVSLFETGNIVVDERYDVLYLRPRHINEKAGVINQRNSWGGTCCNWVKNKGCSFEYENRPSQCKQLIPLLNRRNEYVCDYGPDVNTNFYLKDWKKYQDAIIEAAKIYNNKK